MLKQPCMVERQRAAPHRRLRDASEKCRQARQVGFHANILASIMHRVALPCKAGPSHTREAKSLEGMRTRLHYPGGYEPTAHLGKTTLACPL